MVSRARPILWDIYEEHLDEAAFLWGQWESALDGPLYTLSEVAEGPEERLLAHLDGLVLGGATVSKKLLLPIVEGAEQDDPEAGKLFAAAWVLVSAEDEADLGHLDLVLDRLQFPAPALARALFRAVELGHRPDLPARLQAAWDLSSPLVRAVALEVVAAHDADWTRARLGSAVKSEDPVLVAAGLRALRRFPESALLRPLEAALGAEDANVRREAYAAAYLMGLPNLWDACAADAAANTPACRLPLALYALTPDRRERLFARLAPDSPAARHAIWALGFCPTVESCDALAALLDHPKLGRVAGESFSALTGLTIVGAMATPGETEGPGVADVGDDDPVPETLPEDNLPAPRASAVRTWWARHRDAFSTRSPDPAGPTWRRFVRVLAAARASHSPLATPTRRWARDQQR